MRTPFLVTIAILVIHVGIWIGAGENPIIAVAIFLALVALAVVSPAGAAGAVVLTVPTAFEIHPLVVGSFSLLEIGIVTSAAGIALRVMRGGLSRVHTAITSIAAPVEVMLPALLLAPCALLAFRMMPDTAFRTEALREIRLVILEPLLFLGTGLLVFREGQARVYVWGCSVAIGAIIGSAACLELLVGTGDVVDGAIMRATVTYSHPNNLALFTERMLLLTLPVLLRFPRSWILRVCVTLEGAGVISTFSRGALVAVVIGACAAMLLLGMRRPLLWLAVAVMTGGLVLLAIARDRVLDVGGSGSEPTRFAIWRSAFDMALDHPLFGVGPDQFLYQYSRRYIEPAAWPERYTSHPHNLPLDVWLRIGVPGVACFIGIASGLFLRITRMFAIVRADAIAIGGLCALIGGFVHGLFDNGFFLPDLAVLTWLAVALVLTPGPTSLDSSP